MATREPSKKRLWLGVAEEHERAARFQLSAQEWFCSDGAPPPIPVMEIYGPQRLSAART